MAIRGGNTVRLMVPAEEFLRLIPVEAPLGLVPHSFRERVLDEFLAVAELGLDDHGRVFEQLNHYQLSEPEVLEERPFWTGLMVRDHTDLAVRRMGEVWFGHVLRYSRRDQLSVNFALRQAGLVPHGLALDNHASEFHTWSHPPARERSGIRRPVVSLMPPGARVRAAELALAEQTSRAATLEGVLATQRTRAAESEGALAALTARGAEVEWALTEERALSASLLASTSWRLTAPARHMGRSHLRDRREQHPGRTSPGRPHARRSPGHAPCSRRLRARVGQVAGHRRAGRVPSEGVLRSGLSLIHRRSLLRRLPSSMRRAAVQGPDGSSPPFERGSE